MFFGAKIADSIERNAFFNENHVFFFVFWKLSSARDSASSVLIFLQIHSPPCSDFDPHGSEFARSAFYFLGGRGAGVRKQDDKTRELPGPGPGPGPGWQATGPGQSSSKQTDKQAHTVQNPHIFPIWAAVPSANTAC